MVSARKRTYHWFVEPGDAHTNCTLSAWLSDQNAIAGKCDDKGKPHDLYEVDGRQLDALRKSKAQLGISFKVYVQEGNGKMRLASFLPAIAKRRSAGFPMTAQSAK